MALGLADVTRIALPSLIDQLPWYHDPTTLFQFLIATAAIAQVVTSVLLWRATLKTAQIAQTSLDAANRPLIAMAGIVVSHPAATVVAFKFTVKNFGSVSADSAVGTMDVQFNGAQVPTHGVPVQPASIPPTGTRDFDGWVGEPAFSQLMAGTLILTTTTRVTYKGPRGDSHVYCERHQFDPRLNTFAILGQCP